MQLIDTAREATLYTKVLKLMGNRFEITVVSSDTEWANECIDAAVAEIRESKNC